MDISKRVMSQLLGTVFFVVTSLSMAAPAFAEDDERVRLYLGGGVGFSKMKNGEDVFTGASNKDLQDTGYKAFLGLEFVPNGAMEISVIDLGDFGATHVTNPVYAPTLKVQGVNVGFVGGGDINSFISAHVRFGVFGWRMKFGGTSSSGVPLNEKETGVDLSWGLGTQFNFGRFVALRLEYEQFTDIGELNTGETDLQLISTSLLFRL